MTRFAGIDIRAGHVRGALIQTSYRKVVVERLLEVDIASAGTLEQALLSAALPLAQHADAIAVAVEGVSAFIHRIALPPTALKQMAEVLPFELEAHVPVDIDELVYDYRVLRRSGPSEALTVLTAAARIEHVRERIALVKSVLGREPDRVGCGPLPLANLASLSPDLAQPGPIALIDLGGSRTEVVLLVGGEAVFARTLSRGVQGLPQSAPALAAELRQTFAAFETHGGEPVPLGFLLGGGAAAPGAAEYLGGMLGVRIEHLPQLALEGVPPDDHDVVRRFAKALALAVGLSGRPRDLDLRRGSLAFQRGYGFVKEKAPLLSGLGAAIFISFAFSTWAEMTALSREQEVMTKALGALTKDVFGEETLDPAAALELLEKNKSLEEADPMPHMDAFDVIVEISKAVPSNITHDIEEFDMQRGHVKINGLVGSTADVQLISAALQGQRCFEEVKIAKITQAVNATRQKYVLEFDVKCPEDAGAKKKKKPKSEEAPAEPEKP
jgi:general secretion pathway protein L